ncbi:MAG: aldose 1-epimerase [Acetobacteraceae bacterium]|jgi:aldose 1-epimerase
MLHLQDDQASVVLTPEYGGAVLGWMDDRTPVLRRPLPEAILRGEVRGFACFPLVPFCNRIGLARFAWQGRAYQLERNFGDHPHAIHGVGWQRSWSVGDVSHNAASLTLHHDAAGGRAGAWPFPFDAALACTLADTQLRIALSVTNRHTGTAPAGIGLHPYFGRRAGVTLQFQADGVWLNGEDALPARHVSLPRAWDHANGLPIGTARLDNCFTTWNRTARIGGIGGGVTITAGAAFRHLQVYTPPHDNVFCVEPVSHVPDAINRSGLPPGQGMHVLQPGETLSGSVTIDLTRG